MKKRKEEKNEENFETEKKSVEKTWKNCRRTKGEKNDEVTGNYSDFDH